MFSGSKERDHWHEIYVFRGHRKKPITGMKWVIENSNLKQFLYCIFVKSAEDSEKLHTNSEKIFGVKFLCQNEYFSNIQTT